MAGIEIKAVYADMLKCAEILDNIGADVKLAYTDIDDFLNKKMVFNGKQIYANWQSDARSVFEEKSKVIIDIFMKVQDECSEAANTLRAVIKEYENRDSELAAVTLGKNVTVSALDFKHFGNMDTVLVNGKLPEITISKVSAVVNAGSDRKTGVHCTTVENRVTYAGDLTGLDVNLTSVNKVSRVII